MPPPYPTSVSVKTASEASEKNIKKAASATDAGTADVPAVGWRKQLQGVPPLIGRESPRPGRETPLRSAQEPRTAREPQDRGRRGQHQRQLRLARRGPVQPGPFIDDVGVEQDAFSENPPRPSAEPRDDDVSAPSPSPDDAQPPRCQPPAPFEHAQAVKRLRFSWPWFSDCWGGKFCNALLGNKNKQQHQRETTPTVCAVSKRRAI